MIPAECFFFSYPAVPIIHVDTCWVLGDLIPAAAHRYTPSEKSEYKKKELSKQGKRAHILAPKILSYQNRLSLD